MKDPVISDLADKLIELEKRLRLLEDASQGRSIVGAGSPTSGPNIRAFSSSEQSKQSVPSANKATTEAPAPEHTNPAISLPDIATIRSPLLDPVKTSNKPSGGWLLGAAGIFFFVLAASFFVKLAIDSGWLNPARQFFGLLLFGGALIATGFQLRVKDSPYSGMLSGGGVIILFMTVYSGHLYFELYQSGTATILAAIVSAVSIYLFQFFRHDFFLLTAVVGTYLLPLLVSSYQQNLSATALYFTLWDLLYCALALKLQRRAIIAVVAYLALGVFQTLFTSSDQSIDPSWIIAFQAAQFLVLGMGVVLYSARHNVPLSENESWTFLPVLLLFYAIEYQMLSTVAPIIAPWVSLIFAAILILLYHIGKTAINRQSLPSAPLVGTFVAIVVFHSFYLEILPDSAGPIFAIALFLVAVFLAATEKLLSMARWWPVYLISGAVILREYLRIILVIDLDIDSFGLSALNTVFFMFLFLTYLECKRQKLRDPGWLLVAAVPQALAAIFRLAEVLTSPPASDYLTSGLWGLLGLGLLVWAQTNRDQTLAKASMTVFGLVVFKVLVHDISATSTGVRIFGLIVVGAMLYLGGLVMRQIGKWE